ncbi:MAG: DUF4350 domain-containing protein [Anaerolineaceae bacterium]|nr:DUF4350 domain-containing protein [Anaerolineaceae bacterium]
MAIFILLIVAVMALVAVLFHEQDQAGGAGTFPSSYSHTPGGLLAIYRLLARLGDPQPMRLERPWTDLDGRGHVLLVVGPLRVGPSREEVRALVEWVSRGNTLVYLMGRDRGIDRRANASENLDLALGVQGELEGSAAKGRPLWLVGGLVSSQKRIRPAVASPVILGVREVATYAPRALPVEARGMPLLEEPDGAVHMRQWRVKRGQVYVGVSGSIFSNKLINRADNLALLLNLIEQVDRGSGYVLFDEYHHGYYDREPLTTPFSRRVLLALGVQMFLLVTLFLVSHSRRFGPLKVLARPSRRSCLEFVDALAELYRRGKAGSHAARRLWDDFHEQVTRDLHLSRAAGVDQLATALARRSRRSRESILNCLQEAIRAAETPALSPRRLLSVARNLAQLKKEVL